MGEKREFTLDQHKQTGQTIKQMMIGLNNLINEVEGSYSIRHPRTKDIVRNLDRARGNLELARGALEQCLSEEYPAILDTTIYRGK